MKKITSAFAIIAMLSTSFFIVETNSQNTIIAQVKKGAILKVSYQNVIVKCSARMKLKNVSCVPFKSIGGDEYEYMSVEGVTIVYNKTTGGIYCKNGCEFVDGQFSTSCR